MNKILGWVLGSIIGVALIAVFIWLAGAQFLKWAFTINRTFDFFVLIVVVAAVLATLFITRGIKHSDTADSYKRSQRYASSSYYGSSSKRVETPAVPAPRDLHVLYYILGSAAIVAGLALVVTFAIRSGYDSDRAYVSTIKTTTAAVPSFGPRAPYKVAVQSSARNMGSVTGTAEDVRSVADQGKTGEWNTLIVRQGVGVGYEAVQVVKAPLYGSVDEQDVSFCYFNRSASLRSGGALIQNNLNRVLDWQLPLDVTYDMDDSYGICNGSTPEVIIPLKQVHGFYAAYETPYGVAIYNGKTGVISVTTNAAKIAQIPGSTYPMSLVVDQREATQAVGTLGDYLFGSTGYQITSQSDGGDPNAENPSEFKLRYENTQNKGSVAYVTPVTVRGDSSTIVGVAVTESKKFTPGKLNPYIIYRYKSSDTREANSTVDNDIRSKFAVVQTGYAAGLRVFEIVPAENGTWVASIGQNQVVSYRAIIDENGTITLYNQEGQKVDPTSTDGAPLITNPSTGTTKPTTGTGSGSTTGTVTLPSNLQGLDLSKLTNAQLEELSNEIVAELASRSNQ